MRRPLLVAAILTLCLSLGLGSLPISARKFQTTKLTHTLTKPSSWSAVWDAIREMAALLKNGSGIDPFGHTGGAATSTPPTPTSDNGSGVDPFGGK